MLPIWKRCKILPDKRQRKIDNLRDVKESLEPVQRAVGSEILSSAIILTPDKMQIAMQKSPWEVLDDICPVNLSKPRNNPDIIPIVFEHSSIQYVGWLKRGLLPMVFDCEYDELLVPKTQIQSPYNKIKPVHISHDRLKDGSAGPEMVLIPAGTFRMGEKQSVHEVSVESFAMGRYPVTFAEYDYFCEQTSTWFKKRKKADDEGWGRGNRPVINVSWHDAVAYTEWLSEQTGQEYRLPTEAEWEYAARAGTETDYWWGNDIDETKANYNGNIGHTTPVGDYEANPFGLHDTAGNVWEWTCSKYESEYNSKKTMNTRCCVAARGTTTRRTSVLPSATSTIRSTASTTSASV
ncbi:formylglycine-generating enzyme family protein [Candidatus Marithrix sp. Canyon 246]|uniref:formylglycine-generating enzyme family protein n=1 Tax=Candidatus Marithrix sp. Canyon 246 TaxID=1827136 RepID=UPI000849F791|nr:SUMF1/EgtB/PvdO family nonheme iron enzyme [Candidatus Marithrix sp. Canyon 246]